MPEQIQSGPSAAVAGAGDQTGEQLKKYNEGMAAVMQAMQQMATSVTEGMTAMQESLQSIGERLETIRSSGGNPGSGGGGGSGNGSDADGADDGDYEHLSRSEFASRLRRQFVKDVEGILKPIKDSLEHTSSTSSRTAAAQEAERVAARYTDFWHFKDEMVRVAKEYPDLTVERIYKLAKAEASPEKIKEVEEKMKQAAGGKQANNEQRPGFGGLSSSGGTASIPEVKPGEKVDKITAAERAWNATVPKDSPLATLDQETMSQ